MKTTNGLKWVYLILLSLIWGTSFILIKKSLLGLNAYQLGALRTIITGLFLFIAGFKSIKSIKKESWKWIALSGFMGSFFPSFFFAIAETEIDSAVASILNSLVPLNTVLLGAAIFKIATNTRQVLGVIIGFIGTSILIMKGAELNPNQNYLYATFVILSTIMYAINVNIIKKYLQDVKPLSIATGNYVVIFLPALVILAFTDFFKVENFKNNTFLTSIGFVAVLSFFGTALAKVLFNKLVQMSTPVFASSVTYIMPIVALFWGLLDNETFSWTQGLGTIIILLGVYLANKKPKKIRS
ncbi:MULTISPECIES: DMT family transporter [Mesoflavibacter]|uniref:DMT family transporter n=1 Tax=Mesoflavibacter profundi TaxID=2708110 RepID=A0ABT4S0Y6_9FLAO|nr:MULTISPECIES: DMT family transporter [Mesoflavibacter]MDA0177706.1 DMT family transporter [Mesoflavibacter profundi]QIJ88662.1 Permease of the drug/metabolite transporter (DMT) superfamily [Mesoflavibacter sp. HG96]QIJ91390.1 Permease of the drug/metabolite transporter (DMT) superfamily [Mesoflavibacter sp. HG37]